MLTDFLISCLYQLAYLEYLDVAVRDLRLSVPSICIWDTESVKQYANIDRISNGIFGKISVSFFIDLRLYIGFFIYCKHFNFLYDLLFVLFLIS